MRYTSFSTPATVSILDGYRTSADHAVSALHTDETEVARLYRRLLRSTVSSKRTVFLPGNSYTNVYIVMEVILIRHTSVDVPKGVCYGQTDVPLRDSFEEEASKNFLGAKSPSPVPTGRSRLGIAILKKGKKIARRLRRTFTSVKNQRLLLECSRFCDMIFLDYYRR